MIRPPARTIRSHTFVVRFWHEQAGTGSRWRGRIEHVQSAQSASFLVIEDMLDFLRRFGICMTTSAAEGTEDTQPLSTRD